MKFISLGEVGKENLWARKIGALHECCQSGHLPKEGKLTPRTRTLIEVGPLPRHSSPSQNAFLQRIVLTNMSIPSVEEKAVS